MPRVKTLLSPSCLVTAMPQATMIRDLNVATTTSGTSCTELAHVTTAGAAL